MKNLVEILTEYNLIDNSHIEQIRRLRPDFSESQDVCDILINYGMVSDTDLAGMLAKIFAAQILTADQISKQFEYIDSISFRFLKNYKVLPFKIEGDSVHIWVFNPENSYPIQALEYFFQKEAQLFIGSRGEIERFIEQQYGEGRSAMGALVESIDPSDEETFESIEHLKDIASEAPTIRLVNLILQRAVEQSASDIHIEPFESKLKIRYRIDGVLQDAEAPPMSSAPAIVSRIKIMARLDIAERRLPQDGRMMVRIQGSELDLRVSIIPTSFGESVVMRLLDREMVTFDFLSLGFDEKQIKSFSSILEKPHGIVLVTGPTGSGKTTTLYTALYQLNTVERKIITIEDPVEYQLDGINQIQVKPAIGLDFQSALRSIVRQDPDIIMIGEMRDSETCRIAIQSSLTGHLVLSTLHTNSAASSLIRLLDMGVENYLIASSINGVLAQRLVRRIDKDYCDQFEASEDLIEKYKLDSFTAKRPIYLYRPKPECLGMCYKGRIAITELLIMNDELRTLLMQRADISTLEQAARSAGLVSLYENGINMALSGLTTLDEVIRVTQDDK